MRHQTARADFGFVEEAAPHAEARRHYRAENLPRLIARARQRLDQLTREARELGVRIPEGERA